MRSLVCVWAGDMPALSITAISFAQAKPQADPQMQAVLDELAALNGKPIEMLDPKQARKQPTPTDAVMALLKKQGKSTAPEPVGNVDNRKIPGGKGDIEARVYTPSGDRPFPVLLYFHGGGFVIATNDTYDASCRALCNMAHYVVVSPEYRKSPLPSEQLDIVCASLAIG